MIHKLAQAIELIREEGIRQTSTETISHSKHKYPWWMLNGVFLNSGILTADEIVSVSDRIWYAERETEIAKANHQQTNVSVEFPQAIWNHQSCPRFICEFSSCDVIGPAAMGFTSGGQLLLPTASGNRDTLRGRAREFFDGYTIASVLIPDMAKRSRNATNQHYDPILPLVPFYNRYFYHWVLEYLPKLRMVELYENETGNEPMILIEENPPAFVTESLSLLGYESERWVEWKTGIRGTETLLVTNHRTHYRTSCRVE